MDFPILASPDVLNVLAGYMPLIIPDIFDLINSPSFTTKMDDEYENLNESIAANLEALNSLGPLLGYVTFD